MRKEAYRTDLGIFSSSTFPYLYDSHWQNFKSLPKLECHIDSNWAHWIEDESRTYRLPTPSAFSFLFSAIHIWACNFSVISRVVIATQPSSMEVKVNTYRTYRTNAYQCSSSSRMSVKLLLPPVQLQLRADLPNYQLLRMILYNRINANHYNWKVLPVVLPRETKAQLHQTVDKKLGAMRYEYWYSIIVTVCVRYFSCKQRWEY